MRLIIGKFQILISQISDLNKEACLKCLAQCLIMVPTQYMLVIVIIGKIQRQNEIVVKYVSDRQDGF